MSWLSSWVSNDLGIVLNTRLSANKARMMLFYLKRSFVALAPSTYLPLYKAFYARIFNMQYKHPPPFCPGIARR